MLLRAYSWDIWWEYLSSIPPCPVYLGKESQDLANSERVNSSMAKKTNNEFDILNLTRQPDTILV